MDKSELILILVLLLLAFALTFFVIGSVEAAPAFDWTDTEEFKRIIKNVERWRSTVQTIIEEKEHHPLLTTNLVLALIAQESYGNQYALSDKSARGLMQVMCFNWMDIECNALYDPIFNIEWGIWFLDGGLETCQPTHTNARKCALIIYNCGTATLRCGRFYSDRVLNFWLPCFTFDIHPKSYYTGIREIYLMY